MGEVGLMGRRMNIVHTYICTYWGKEIVAPFASGLPELSLIV